MHECVRDTRATPGFRASGSLALAVALASGPTMAAGFFEDSHATLGLKNYYLDRDYKDGGAKSAAREWAQGFNLNIESGFTEGPLGFGLDARGLLGVKLTRRRRAVALNCCRCRKATVWPPTTIRGWR